ncbi:hypothetical protein AB0K15_16165 [Amycolatopsis sp. NPDC049253]|uniref:hypothetical protein n=1 Tax=Amycolatopsis sp. NPDC049253 TaxID=3155274 RepID=UPI00341240AD
MAAGFGATVLLAVEKDEPETVQRFEFTDAQLDFGSIEGLGRTRTAGRASSSKTCDSPGAAGKSPHTSAMSA